MVSAQPLRLQLGRLPALQPAAHGLGVDVAAAHHLAADDDGGVPRMRALLDRTQQGIDDHGRWLGLPSLQTSLEDTDVQWLVEFRWLAGQL
jgi:hypothetical protein